MSRSAPSRTKAGKASRTFCIVGSRFNAKYVDALVNHVSEELRGLAPDASISVYRVPGAFEIPVVVQELADHRRVDAIVACGVILKGETDHAQNLGRSVTDALQRITGNHAVPVINAVLSFDNEEQARARCLEDRMNRGTEAARAAVEISNVMSELRRSGGAAAFQQPTNRLQKRHSTKRHIRDQRRFKKHG